MTKKILDNKLKEVRFEKVDLELVDIVDTDAIQSLMNNFCKLTHIPIGLNDLKVTCLHMLDGRKSAQYSTELIQRRANTV